MAQGKRLVCQHCAHEVEAWSDGNPYYFDQAGAKRYAYHPDHENLERCIGNDAPHLCLACGSAVMIDSRRPREDCPECETGPLVSTWELEGEVCPSCKIGKFVRDPNYNPIS